MNATTRHFAALMRTTLQGFRISLPNIWLFSIVRAVGRDCTGLYLQGKYEGLGSLPTTDTGPSKPAELLGRIAANPNRYCQRRDITIVSATEVSERILARLTEHKAYARKETPAFKEDIRKGWILLSLASGGEENARFFLSRTPVRRDGVTFYDEWIECGHRHIDYVGGWIGGNPEKRRRLL